MFVVLKQPLELEKEVLTFTPWLLTDFEHNELLEFDSLFPSIMPVLMELWYSVFPIQTLPQPFNGAPAQSYPGA